MWTVYLQLFVKSFRDLISKNLHIYSNTTSDLKKFTMIAPCTWFARLYVYSEVGWKFVIVISYWKSHKFEAWDGAVFS